MADHLVITLLRHSLTKENEEARYIGWTDSQLSEKGRQLVLERKKVYEKRKTFEAVDLIITSDLKRAKETAGLLFDRPFRLEARFKEMNFGIFEGKSYEELKDNPAYQAWLNALDTYKIPKGESSEDMRLRVLQAFNDLLRQMKIEGLKNAVIVTHGGVIRHLVQAYKEEAIDFFEIKTPFVAGYRLKFIQKGASNQCTSLQAVPIMEN